MLVSEFVERTGYVPKYDDDGREWSSIQRDYNSWVGDKDSFCKHWKLCNPDKADSLTRIREANELKERQFNKCLKWCAQHSKPTSKKFIDYLMVDKTIAKEAMQELHMTRDEFRETMYNVYKAKSLMSLTNGTNICGLGYTLSTHI